jgi:exodeoxyribonuclease V alpha subunit
VESRASAWDPLAVESPREEPRRKPGGGSAVVLQGTVETLTFHNPDTGFAVIKLFPESGYGDPEIAGWAFPAVAAVGLWERPTVGARVRLLGRWTRHSTHGRRFEFDSAELLAPESTEGLLKYLASGAFEGVGPATAQRIVDVLGLDALERIQKDPEVLATVPGLKKKVRDELARELTARLSEHARLAFLRGTGLNAVQARAVYARWGDECETIVRRDPYALAEVIAGIGFATVDRIAESLGWRKDSLERCRAGLVHELKEAAGDGHVLVPRERLIASTLELLDAPGRPLVERALDELVASRRVVEDGEDRGDVYLAYLHRAETALVTSIARLLCAGDVTPIADTARVRAAEAQDGLELDDAQREAVVGLLSHPVALLTGGPGVGKTTIVRLVVELAERAAARVLLASPTGRAARRLSEATGRDAATIHRMLGYDPMSGGFAFGSERPLEADLVIVDEVSMLDISLAASLFAAVQAPTRIVLVGDPNQLPSVAPGNVLHDLIETGVLPVFRLSHIYRQKTGGLIVANAHRILSGVAPLLPERGDREADFYFFPADDAVSTAERLVEVVTERIPATFGLGWMREVQVLAPMYRGDCGVDVLNERLRAAALGPAEVGLFGEERRAVGFRVGDRVIQTRNDYEKDVFNGDMGRISAVHADGSLTVAFPERELHYASENRSDLQLAFAITVHRAQGSEYPAVVFPLVTQHSVMLRRNLLYTAVTRAKRLVVLVGSRRALELALANDRDEDRQSRLAPRLRKQLEAD